MVKHFSLAFWKTHTETENYGMPNIQQRRQREGEDLQMFLDIQTLYS